MKSTAPKKFLGVFALAMINCAAIVSLRNLPAMAEYGFSMVFFYLAAVFLFLIPEALVAAELATGFPGEGGIFYWVSQALGRKTGFFVVWLQFLGNAVACPACLAYLAPLLAYAFGHPEWMAVSDTGLNIANFYTFAVIFVITWAGTFIGLHGMRLASLVTSIGSICGTLIPGALIIILGLGWIITGHELCTPVGFSELIPHFGGVEQCVLFLGVLLGFSGLEMSAAHANNVNNPQKNYPRAIFISTLLILGVSILGSLAIAVSVPKETLTLEAGVIQAIEVLLEHFHLSTWTRPIAGLMALGAVAWFMAWITGPSRSLLAAAKTGELPASLQKTNAAGMPSTIMLWQAIVITFFAGLFLLIPSVKACFWILSAVTTQSLLIIYTFMFLSGIILRFKFPKTPRAYKVPGGNIGMIILCTIAIISCLFCYGIGFIPPEEIHFENKTLYLIIMLLGNAIEMLPPFLLKYYRGDKKFL
ncbi:MAG: APC family permease [Opitutales bacterium]|nr:APC family permease [Opitutales bacterium]